MALRAKGAEAEGTDAEGKEAKVGAKQPAHAATKKPKYLPKVALYAPEVQAKINANKDKLAAMVGELQLEGVADYCDVRLCVQLAERSLRERGAAVEGADAVEEVKPVEGVEGVVGVDESVVIGCGNHCGFCRTSSAEPLDPDTPVETVEPTLGDRLSSLHLLAGQRGPAGAAGGRGGAGAGAADAAHKGGLRSLRSLDIFRVFIVLRRPPPSP
mmetsp:Transcript_23445/g.52624  ORF Transcript_23445/g.52624 Transcript_23445/m.52624 type:complete len:214 (+) Transcript_23445:450-1091(+)